MNNRHCNEEKQAGRRGPFSPCRFRLCIRARLSPCRKKTERNWAKESAWELGLLEGHGFSRAVDDSAMSGFSRWGTVFPSSKFSYALTKDALRG